MKRLYFSVVCFFVYGVIGFKMRWSAHKYLTK